MLRRYLAMYVLLILVMPALPLQLVHACSCPRFGPLEKNWSKEKLPAPYVFVGKLISSSSSADTWTVDMTYSVSRTWNSDIPSKVKIRGGPGGGSCGWFSDNTVDEFVIFASGPDVEHLSSSMCSDNHRFSTSKIVEYYGPGFVPQEVIIGEGAKPISDRAVSFTDFLKKVLRQLLQLFDK